MYHETPSASVITPTMTMITGQSRLNTIPEVITPSLASQIHMPMAMMMIPQRIVRITSPPLLRTDGYVAFVGVEPERPRSWADTQLQRPLALLHHLMVEPEVGPDLALFLDVHIEHEV